MPCNSDYMQADWREEYSSMVREFLREINGGEFNHSQRHEYYGNLGTLDKDVAKLCAWCSSHDVTKQSLELQLWWRDHQAEDAKRMAEESEQRHQDELRKKALAKLSAAERKALKV